MNEQNTREAAKRRTISEYRQGKSRGDYFAGDDEGALRVGFASGYDHGLDAGAASVDRVEIVREAFEEVKTYLKSQWLFDSEFAQSTYKAGDREQVGWNGGIEKSFEAMDAVLAEYEEKQK